MTSPFSIGIKKFNGTVRTVRDIVEREPEQISEVWCRKIFRHLLQALERQYAMQLPHRAITPDTVIFRDDGMPQLLPSLTSDPAPAIADDLTALARIVHYAITREVVPGAPLRGRAPEGYSDSLLTAIDRSLAPDPARRPRTIAEVRDLLGIVAFRRAAPGRMQAGAAPDAAPAGPVPRAAQRRPGRQRRRHWVLAGGAALLLALLVPVGVVLVDDVRGRLAVGHVVLAPPPGSAVRAGPDPSPMAVTPPLPDPPPAPAAASPVFPPLDETPANSSAVTKAAQAAQVEESPPRLRDAHPRGTGKLPGVRIRPATPKAGPAQLPAPDSAPESAQFMAAAPAPAAASPRTALPAAPVSAAGAVVSLQIKPWGVVVVDEVRRGVSPPIKQLVLAPGRHTIVVSNPGGRQRTLEVDTAGGDSHIAVDFDSGQ